MHEDTEISQLEYNMQCSATDITTCNNSSSARGPYMHVCMLLFHYSL